MRHVKGPISRSKEEKKNENMHCVLLRYVWMPSPTSIGQSVSTRDPTNPTLGSMKPTPQANGLPKKKTPHTQGRDIQELRAHPPDISCWPASAPSIDTLQCQGANDPGWRSLVHWREAKVAQQRHQLVVHQVDTRLGR